MRDVHIFVHYSVYFLLSYVATHNPSREMILDRSERICGSSSIIIMLNIIYIDVDDLFSGANLQKCREELMK